MIARAENCRGSGIAKPSLDRGGDKVYSDMGAVQAVLPKSTSGTGICASNSFYPHFFWPLQAVATRLANSFWQVVPQVQVQPLLLAATLQQAWLLALAPMRPSAKPTQTSATASAIFSDACRIAEVFSATMIPGGLHAQAPFSFARLT